MCVCVCVCVCIYNRDEKSNAFFFGIEIITETGTCIIHQNETGPPWITSLLLSIVTISLFECGRVSLPRKNLWTALWATSSHQFSLPRHWHKFCRLNPHWWDQRDVYLKALNFVNLLCLRCMTILDFTRTPGQGRWSLYSGGQF